MKSLERVAFTLDGKYMFIPIVPIFCFVIWLYAFYMLWMLGYWRKAIGKRNFASGNPSTNVSVVIPFRNESQNLPALLESILQQTYPKHLVKYLFVNDHSEDDGEMIVKNAVVNQSQILLANLETDFGKKAALHKGISLTESELIITIDADVELNKNWLSQIVRRYETEREDMIILPIAIQSNNKIFQSLQQLDFMALAGLTGASAKMKSPLMCNGANLCFTRAAYDKVFDKIAFKHISSGDDMFLMLALKKNKQFRIGYFFDTDVIAETKAMDNLAGFLAQRVRWASKGTYLKDGHIFFCGLLITITNLLLLLLGVWSAFGKLSILYFICAFAIKLMVDFIFLRTVSLSFGKKLNFLHVLLLSITYPFYILLIPILTVFYAPKWKGRTISLRPDN